MPTPRSSNPNAQVPPRSSQPGRVSWGRGCWGAASRSIMRTAWPKRRRWWRSATAATPEASAWGDGGLHPLVELADVVLAGHQHAALRVHPRAHGRLAALARVEVLGVDPVEQLDRRV